MRITKSGLVILGVYLVTALFWLCFIWFSRHTATYEGSLYNYVLKPFLVGMTLLPLVGGIAGLVNARQWGGWSSTAGRGVIGISLGLIAWSGGMIIWNFYLFFTDVEVPYPSLADAIFILSWPLWTYGLAQISKTVGIKYALRRTDGKITLVLIPVAAVVLSYYFLFEVARGGQISFDGSVTKLFFDLFYPIGDLVIITFATLIYGLSRSFLGGIYKKTVLLLLFGFFLNYISDFIFSYTTTKETYFNGHVVDFIFTTTMFVLSLSLSFFTPSILNDTSDTTSGRILKV